MSSLSRIAMLIPFVTAPIPKAFKPHYFRDVEIHVALFCNHEKPFVTARSSKR